MSEADEQFERFEAKMDELNLGLLESYCAGFRKAQEVYDVGSDESTVKGLMQNEAVEESHYYYWDGRSKPLEFWLRDQFGVE